MPITVAGLNLYNATSKFQSPTPDTYTHIISTAVLKIAILETENVSPTPIARQTLQQQYNYNPESPLSFVVRACQEPFTRFNLYPAFNPEFALHFTPSPERFYVSYRPTHIMVDFPWAYPLEVLEAAWLLAHPGYRPYLFYSYVSIIRVYGWERNSTAMLKRRRGTYWCRWVRFWPYVECVTPWRTSLVIGSSP